MDNKQKIQQNAIKLFYDQGYKSTTIAQIAQSCNISSGVVSYYYKTKSLLGNEISGIFSLKRKNLVARKYYEKYKTYDLEYAIAVEMRLLFQLYSSDTKALRFYSELSNFGHYDKMSIASTNQIKYYQKFYKKYNLSYDKDNDELSLLAHTISGAVDSMLFAYFQNQIDCDDEFACNYYIHTFFILQKFSQERINKITDVSLSIFKDLEFKFNPYFSIE